MNPTSWIYKDIDSLHTPCGDITITDENGNKIKFSVKKNPFRPDYDLFYGTSRQEAVNTDTNFLICVEAGNLTLHHSYKLSLSGSHLHFGDSDEHTEAVSGTSDGYSIAIGAYDPNDDEKMSQAENYSERQGYLAQRIIMEPPKYDKSPFVQYDVEMLTDYSGFTFILLERTIDEIVFTAAWIENKTANSDEYEGAVEFWTT